MGLRSQIFDFLRETFCRHALEYLQPARSEKKSKEIFYSWEIVWLLTILKARGWSGHIFAASVSPSTSTKKLAMSPSSAVHGGQYYAQYVTFE